jgi:hypothetical protein
LPLKQLAENKNKNKKIKINLDEKDPFGPVSVLFITVLALSIAAQFEP